LELASRPCRMVPDLHAVVAGRHARRGNAVARVLANEVPLRRALSLSAGCRVRGYFALAQELSVADWFPPFGCPVALGPLLS